MTVLFRCEFLSAFQELKSTSVKKGCTKSKKTPKFGAGPFAKLNCRPNQKMLLISYNFRTDLSL